MDAAIDAWVDAHTDMLVELAQALVRIPTENRPPSGDELAGQRLVEECLVAVGAEIDVFTPDDVPELHDHQAYVPMINGQQRDYHDRPNVVGTIQGSGSGRSVLFSTHIDTVPAGPASAWRVGSPFGGEVIDGRLYGRGSYDTKCALASHLTAIHCLRELGIELAGDVLIESVVDEEYGGSHGVMAARLRGHQADIAFNSEPTHLAVCPAHRGVREGYVRMRGNPGLALGGEEFADAVLGLARAIVAMRAFDVERNQAPRPPLFAHETRLPMYFNQIGGGGTTYEDAIGAPEDTYLLFSAEVYPGTTAEEFDDALMHAVQGELDAHPDTVGQQCELQPTSRFLPGSSMPLRHAGLDMLREVFADLPGRDFDLRGAPFACDAYVFNLHSPTPAVVFGPGGGGAHAPDEYVLVDDLVDVAKVSARFIFRWCGVAT